MNFKLFAPKQPDDIAEASRKLQDQVAKLSAAINKAVFKDLFNNFPKSFRQLVQSAVEREEWRGKIQDYLDEAFANECEIQYDDFVTEEGTKKVLTINWETK